MKELSIEEKVKRFDEAIERAKAIYYQGSYKPDTAATIAETLQNIFPELAESEDERVKKELLAVIDDLILPDEQKERFIAWLEKQGEKNQFLMSKFPLVQIANL